MTKYRVTYVNDDGSEKYLKKPLPDADVGGALAINYSTRQGWSADIAEAHLFNSEDDAYNQRPHMSLKSFDYYYIDECE